MKYKNGAEWQTVSGSGGGNSEQTIVPDYVPIGTEVDYDGTVVPDGWEQVEDNKPKLLWTNTNPTSNFDAQTITLSSDDYDMLEWYYLYNNASVQKVMKCEKVPKGYSPQLELIYGNGAIRRICDYVSNTSYSIRSNVGAGNEYIIPLYIIGYKTGLFSGVNN